jgi:hypothetical protein
MTVETDTVGVQSGCRVFFVHVIMQGSMYMMNRKDQTSMVGVLHNLIDLLVGNLPSRRTGNRNGACRTAKGPS